MTLIQPPGPVPFVDVVKGRPPAGMIKAEADIMTAWLAANFQHYDSVEFNVRVGRGQDPGSDVDPWIRAGLIANSQRRIDALLMKGEQATIIEVKVRGSLWAMGQLYGYRVLWLRDVGGRSLPLLMMLCGSIDQDTAYAFHAVGVSFQVVSPAQPTAPIPQL